LYKLEKDTPKRILILGAGVAGLRVAFYLHKRVDPVDVEIVLIEENNYHQYLYRIHEVCNNHYEDEEIIVPISRLLKGKRVKFLNTSVTGVDPERRVVETTDGDQPYDALAITLGSHPEYYGIEGLEKNSLTLGSFEQAKRIRDRIEELFEEAEETKKPPVILIGGGGFSGVELAGEIADWYPILCERYSLEVPQELVTIIEAMPTILPGWNLKLVEKAQKVLGNLGVNLILGDPITRVTSEQVEARSGRTLEPDLFVWTGGVKMNQCSMGDVEIRGRRIVTDEYNRVPNHPDIFVAGDCACAVDETGRPQPPTAHIAMVQGDIIGHNIHALLTGGAMKRYEFDRVGEIVTLGKTNAVGELFGLKFSGTLAKFMKKVVHWWYLYTIGGIGLVLGS
jgi:NADH dehydrogenase